MNRSPSAPSLPSSARPASSALPEGTVFAGRYRVVRTIAAGGMGTVYEVVHTETERRRALKVMHPHLFQSDEMRERFKREARIAGQVESEYIVDVSDAGVDEATQTPFIVMELLQGEDLGQRLKRLGRLPPAEVVTFLQQVGLALDRTHARSIVHRDLKPDNVFVTAREDGAPRVKILDFGVAKLVAEGATSGGSTRSLGTPLYMSPEQFRIGSKLVGAADVYALGMMAYTLLVGQPYWATEARAAGDVIAFAMTVVQGPQESAVRRAAQSGVTLPPTFDAWFAKVAAPSPEDRYSSASEAVRALGAALAPAPAAARRPETAPARPAAPVPASAPAADPDPGPRRAATVPLPPTQVARPPIAPVQTSASPAAPAPASPAAPVPAALYSLPIQESGPQGTVSIQAGARGSHAPPAWPVSQPAPAGPVSQPLAAGPAAWPVSQPASGVLEQASSSTGAAVAPIPPERSRGPSVPVGHPAAPSPGARRAPLLVAVAVMGVVLVGAAAWFLVGRAGGPVAASSDPAASAEPAPPAPASPPASTSAGSTEAPASPEPAPSPAASSSAASSAASAASSAASAPVSAASSAASAASTASAPKPSAAPTPKPAASPPKKPAAKPLLGRD
jgi:serine/threonine protein kinase